MRLGYARVSTQDQDTRVQLTALKAANCDRVFQEKASGGRWERPKLQELLGQQQEVVELVSTGKKSAADAARLFQVHPATVSRLMAQHRATQLDQAPKPVPPTKSKRPATKKTRSKKTSSRKKAATKPVETVLDAIGLARLTGFKDFPGAVSVMCEAKTLPKGKRLDWQPISPRQFMAVWEAEALIGEFRDSHADAVIEQRYKVADKTIIELMASYADKRTEHRVVCQARDR